MGDEDVVEDTGTVVTVGWRRVTRGNSTEVPVTAPTGRSRTSELKASSYIPT
jgi:hypothetical protein